MVNAMRSVVSLFAAGAFIVGGGAMQAVAETPAPAAAQDKKDGEIKEDKPAVETHPIVTMETNRGMIRIRLYPEDAPKTVENFIKLASKGYYDGLRFHRVEPGFVIQGGDPKGNGSGGPGYTIPDEKNKKLKHVVGAVAMAKVSNVPNSAGSQFYIVISKPATALDGKYTIFGQVIEGQSAAERMRRNDQMLKVTVTEPAPPAPAKNPAPEETTAKDK